MDLTALGIHTNFTMLDWVIVAAYMLGTVAIGLYVKGYISNMGDYVVAGRAVRSYLGIATMIGTELGLVTVMYASQAGFTRGLAALHVGLVWGIATLFVGLSGFIVVPLRRMGVMTIPEFYERRFGRDVRVFGGLLLALSGILNMGMFLKAGSLFVMGVTGLTAPVHLNIIMTVLLGLVLVYTILGGMISVILTDYIQFVVLSFGLVATCIIAVCKLGWPNIVAAVTETKGEAGLNPFNAEGFGPNYVVWMFFVGVIACAVWQTAVMRACAAKDTKVVKRLYTFSALGFMIRWLLPAFLGVCALTFITRSDALAAAFFPAQEGAKAADSLMAMPLFLSQILPTGILGLVTAGMLAGFMSTHDSYLLCWSSVLTQDVVAPLAGDRLSTKTRLFLARMFILLIGLFILVWGLWYPLGQNLWDYMAITGAIYFTGAFSVLALGLYWKRASRTGAWLALTAGFAAVLGLKPVHNVFLAPIEKCLHIEISSATIGITVVALSVILMIAGSLLFPARAENESD